MAPPAPSLRENAPASSSARTSRNPSAPLKFVAASAFFLRLTPYPIRLWIAEFFRGSLASQQWLEDTSATEPLRRWHHSTVHGCTSPKTPIGISSSQIRQILEFERSILAAQSRR